MRPITSLYCVLIGVFTNENIIPTMESIAIIEDNMLFAI